MLPRNMWIYQEVGFWTNLMDSAIAWRWLRIYRIAAIQNKEIVRIQQKLIIKSFSTISMVREMANTNAFKMRREGNNLIAFF